MAGTYVVGASPTRLAAPAARTGQSEQVAAGQQVYEQVCVVCHGDAGEGAEGPAIAGPSAEVVTFRNARRLVEYVQELMPDDAPGSLAEQQYYDVVAFLLAWNNLNPGQVPVDPASAESITFSR